MLSVLFFVSCQQAQEKEKHKKHEALGVYYPLDSVESVEMQNWRGEHHLSKSNIKLLAQDLKTFYYVGNFARIKPGHLWLVIIFKNGRKLSFYGDGQSEIIISDCHTFETQKHINFENY